MYFCDFCEWLSELVKMWLLCRLPPQKHKSLGRRCEKKVIIYYWCHFQLLSETCITNHFVNRKILLNFHRLLYKYIPKKLGMEFIFKSINTEMMKFHKFFKALISRPIIVLNVGVTRAITGQQSHSFLIRKDATDETLFHHTWLHQIPNI